jgi:hypothetical protein
LVGRGIGTYIHAISPESGLKGGDLGLGGIYLGLVQIVKNARHHEGRQHRQNGKNDQKFN